MELVSRRLTSDCDALKAFSFARIDDVQERVELGYETERLSCTAIRTSDGSNAAWTNCEVHRVFAQGVRVPGWRLCRLIRRTASRETVHKIRGLNQASDLVVFKTRDVHSGVSCPETLSLRK